MSNDFRGARPTPLRYVRNVAGEEQKLRFFVSMATCSNVFNTEIQTVVKVRGAGRLSPPTSTWGPLLECGPYSLPNVRPMC